jgi:ABC-type spermidine/putrescine transport system permease subunit I
MIWLSLGAIVSLFSATLPYGEPQTWLTMPFWNNFFLMVVLIWIQTGFAMVILSAALRGIPEETVEAAIDRRRQPVPDLLQDQGAADHGHHRRGLDHDHLSCSRSSTSSSP